MNITDYLKTIGFKRVEQSDQYGRFLDPDYVCLDGLYAELHDDGMFYLWTDVFNPILEIDQNIWGFDYTANRVTKLINTFKTPISIKH